MRGLAAFALAAAVLLPAAGAGENWPHYLGPNYDGKPTATSFSAKAATQVWKASVGTSCSSMTIVDGLLYTMGNDGKTNRRNPRDTVHCLDAATGKGVWAFAYPCKLEPRFYPGGPNATPTVDSGKVYTLSKAGHLLCLDARTGRKVWDASASNLNPKGGWWGYAGSPTVVGDVVLYNIGDKGTLIWGTLGDASFTETYRTKVLSGLCWSCPVLLGARLYARDAQGTVVCLRLE